MRIAARGLGHAFPGRPQLFAAVDFDLDGGDICAVIGPSGSGKSTLLSMLAGWTKPSTGTLVHDKVEGLTWVPQNPFGVAQRTVLDHAVLPLLARGEVRKEAEREARLALSQFGLADVIPSRFGELSGGEGQRLMLARASLSRTNLLLVDEPTAQLDPASSGSVIEILGNLAHAGRIVVIATHDPRVTAAAGLSIRLGVA